MNILTAEGKERLAKKKNFIIKTHKKINEWSRKHMLLTIFAAICWSITPFMFYICDIERGYDALGGEAFIPILPVFVYLINEAIRKDREK